MNILVAVNRKYLEALKNMLFSVCSHTAVVCEIYLVYQNLKQRDLKGLQVFIEKKCHSKVHLIRVSSQFLADAKVTGHFSIEMYYRIFVSSLVPQTLERIMWLDADIIAEGNIQSFYHQDFEGKSLIACKDQLQELRGTDHNHTLHLPERYAIFNSGVLLFNLDKIRTTFDSKKVLSMIKEYGTVLRFPDQDLLNMLYCNDVKYADGKYNRQYFQHFTRWKSADSIYKECSSEFIVIHYIGEQKPWMSNYCDPMDRYYWKYKKLRHQYIQYYLHYAIEKMCYVGRKIKHSMRRY